MGKLVKEEPARITMRVSKKVHDKVVEVAQEFGITKIEALEKLVFRADEIKYEKLDLSKERINRYAWYIFKLVTSVTTLKTFIYVKLSVFEGLEDVVSKIIDPKIESQLEQIAKVIEQIECRLGVRLDSLYHRCEVLTKQPHPQNVRNLNDELVRVIEDLIVKATYKEG